VPDESPAQAPRLRDVIAAFGDQTFNDRYGVGAVRLGEGLRERKKRLTRQNISDVATAMFLERGFDAVRVAEVAAVCGVSEKTVYNYFPTKESLLLDREEEMAAGIRRALGPGANERVSPIEAAVGVIVEDVRRFYRQWEGEPDFDLTSIRRFSALVETTPSLRAAQRDMMDRLVQVAADAMAARAGMDPADPEPQIAAHAMLGLWRVQFTAQRKYSDGSLPLAEVRAAVIAEVRRAARLIDTGLWSFGLAVQGSSGREQFKAAAESANEARKQVMLAIRQARDAWRQVMADAQVAEHAHDHRGPHRSARAAGRPDRAGPPS
jgi:AcrR family transcriptional regulator